MKRRKWTERQVAYLIRHYADRDTEVLCQRLRRKRISFATMPTATPRYFANG